MDRATATNFMKVSVLFLFLIVYSCGVAQEIKQKQESVNGSYYDYYLYKTRLIVRNSKNKLFNQDNRHQDSFCNVNSIIHRKDAVGEIVNDHLDKNDSKDIGVFFYINNCGKILELDFNLPLDNNVKLDKILEIENLIIKEIDFEFNNVSCDSKDYILFSYLIRIE
jgi:hypothetical protein